MKNQKGYTLVELMATLGLSTMIAGGFFLAMNVSDIQIQTASRKMSIEDAAREGLYRMVQEIRMSAVGKVTITTPSAGYEVIQFNVPSSSTPVNLNPADAVTDYSTDWTTAQLIQYDRGGLNCDKLIRSTCTGGVCPAATCPCTTGCTDTLAAGQSVLANNISNLDFDNTTDPDIVQVNMQVQQTLYAHGQRNLVVDSSGNSAPLVMTAKADLRNS